MADIRDKGQAGNLGQFIKQQRTMRGLTLEELGASSSVSPSHLGRIERGERFPSAPVLRRIAGPLGLNEEELFAFAGFLSSPSAEAQTHTGRIDPYVAGMLASETMATQRTLVGLLYLLKSIARD
jgi:transcriptional regulator with XRE-family HTH domain